MKIEKIIYGWMPNNELSRAEKEEFEIQAKKLGCKYSLHENFDHIPTPEVYQKVNTFKANNGITKGPGGAGTASNFCSHISIWHKIVKENKPCAIFEHDARPVINFENLIEVNDNEIVLLGPRVPNLEYYSFPENVKIKYYEVEHHAGSHAYAITPKTAHDLINHIEKDGVNDSIDQWLFLRLKKMHVGKMLNLSLKVCDPPVAVAVFGNKKSSIGRVFGSSNQPTDNLYTTPGFTSGIVSTKEIQ